MRTRFILCCLLVLTAALVLIVLLRPGGQSLGRSRSGETAASGALPRARSVAARRDRIRIAAFNVQVFGRAKAAQPDVLSVLARVAREFDLMVVEEVRDAAGAATGRLLEEINAEAGPRYALREGPREGRSVSKEAYALYYAPERVELLKAELLPDPTDAFEREPLVAWLKSGDFDFVLLAIHVKPEDAGRELAALAVAADSLLDADPAEKDLILLGDFNADCNYFSERGSSNPLRGPGFHWIITDAMDTTTGSTRCTYDRIVLLEGTLGHEYVPDSAGVFRFDLEYDLPPSLTRRVSDHYPVYAEFWTSLGDDD